MVVNSDSSQRELLIKIYQLSILFILPMKLALFIMYVCRTFTGDLQGLWASSLMGLDQ